MKESFGNAEALICGETFDVDVISGPDSEELCKVAVLFEEGEYVETMAIHKANIFPITEEAIGLLMNS